MTKIHVIIDGQSLPIPRGAGRLAALRKGIRSLEPCRRALISWSDAAPGSKRFPGSRSHSFLRRRLRHAENMIENGRMKRVFEPAAGHMIANPTHGSAATFEAGKHHPDFHPDGKARRRLKSETAQRHFGDPASKPALALPPHFYIEQDSLTAIEPQRLSRGVVRKSCHHLQTCSARSSLFECACRPCRFLNAYFRQISAYIPQNRAFLGRPSPFGAREYPSAHAVPFPSPHK